MKVKLLMLFKEMVSLNNKYHAVPVNTKRSYSLFKQVVQVVLIGL
jgi:hypothetical protein